MPGKVVHLSEETHLKMVEFCKINQIKASQWVEGLIFAAVGDEIIVPQPPTELTKKFEPVKKKKLPTEVETPVSEDNPWERPPFWKKHE